MRLRGRRWWTHAIAALAFIVVVAATLSAVFTLALDVMPAWREALQARVAQRIGMPVKVDAMRLSWRTLQPELALRAVTVLDAAGKPVLHIGVLRVGIDYSALLHGELRPARIELDGLALTLDADAQGRWTVHGFPASGPAPAATLNRLLGGLSHVRLQRCRITIDDARLDTGPLVFNVRASVDRSNEQAEPRYRVHLAVTPPAVLAGSLDAHLVVYGKLFQGSTWQHHWRGHWRATLDGLRRLPWLDAWLGAGRRLVFDGASLHAQGHFVRGRPSHAALHFSTTGLAMTASGGHQAAVRDVVAQWVWQADGDGWTLTAQQLSARAASGAGQRWNLAPASLRWRTEPQGWSLEAKAARLQLSAVVPWLKLWPGAAAQVADRPALHGTLRDMALTLHGATPGADAARATETQGSTAPGGSKFRLSARLQDVGWAAHDALPGIDGVSGQLKMDAGGGELQTDSAPTLRAPRVFSAPVKLDALDTTVRWQRAPAGGWSVAAEPLHFSLYGVSGGGHVRLSLPPVDAPSAARQPGRQHGASRPVPGIDLDLRFKAADAARLKPLMLREWSPHLRHWLAQALVKVPVKDAHLLIDGPLHGFPYANGTGHWQLDAQLADATLRFDPHWPAARGLAAKLHFAGDAMHIDVSGARLGKVRVSKATADVPKLRDGILAVDATASADMTDWFALLNASPLRSSLHALLDESTASGPAGVHVALSIPLHDEKGTAHVTGSARIDGVRYRYAALPVPVTGLHGVLSFDGHGLTGLQLDGTLDGEPLTATLARPATAAAVSGATPARTALAITFKADPAHSALAAHYVPAWLRRRLRGATTWRLELPLERAQEWTLDSNLQGTRIDLPPPLGKPASRAAPVQVRATSAADGLSRLYVDGDGRFDLRVRFGGNPQTVQGIGLRVGPGPPVDDHGDGVRVKAAVNQLDLGAWFKVLAHASFRLPGAGSPGAGNAAAGRGRELAFLGADVSAGQLRWGDARVADVTARLVPQPAAGGTALHVDLSGANARGDIVWNEGAGTLRGRLAALHLEAVPTRAGAASRGAKRDSDKAGEGATPLDPNTLPTVDLHCNALSVGDYVLGTLAFRSVRTSGGQKVLTASLSGPSAGVSLQGDWTRVAGQSSARVGFAVKLRRLGDALQAFGFARTVTAQHAQFIGSVAFPASVGGLDPARVKGKVEVKLEDGELTSVRPGIGRVFGLLNLYALPRRVLHSFRDVADKGLTYDHMSAHFALADGQARTDDAHIAGPSVNLDIQGRIGLQAHDLDETVRVQPKIASGITLGAALLGGPIAGGVALLAQALVGKAINHLAELRYRVTGSWDNPKVEHLGSTPVSAAGEPATASTVAPATPAPSASRLPVPAPAASAVAPAP